MKFSNRSSTSRRKPTQLFIKTDYFNKAINYMLFANSAIKRDGNQAIISHRSNRIHLYGRSIKFIRTQRRTPNKTGSIKRCDITDFYARCLLVWRFGTAKVKNGHYVFMAFPNLQMFAVLRFFFVDIEKMSYGF